MHEDELTRLLRESAPDARPSDEHRRLLRMQLQHNFHHHRRPRLRLPSAPAAAVVATVALLVAWSVPIGSDTFDLIRTGHIASTGQELLKEPFGPGYRVSVGDGEEGRERAEFRRLELAAGAYDVVSVSGFRIGDRTYLDYGVRPWADPQLVSTVQIPAYAGADAVVMARLEPIRKEFFARLAQDDWDSTWTEVMTVEGRRYLVTVKAAEFPEVGRAEVLDGRPLD